MSRGSTVRYGLHDVVGIGTETKIFVHLPHHERGDGTTKRPRGGRLQIRGSRIATLRAPNRRELK